MDTWEGEAGEEYAASEWRFDERGSGRKKRVYKRGRTRSRIREESVREEPARAGSNTGKAGAHYPGEEPV